MSDSKKRSFCSFLTQSVPIMALAVCFAPSMACADPFLILQTDRNSAQAHGTPPHSIKPAVTVGLNDNGDLMVRHRDISLVVAYNPPNDIIEPQERIRIVQRQECPTVSGISLKVTFLF